jgi:hypothetical protein
MCACINHGQVRMDYVFFIPPPPFRIRVKLDKKDGDGRSVRMDCDCAMIECLYDFAPGR